MNVKIIGNAEIEDFIFAQDDVSPKTRLNIKSCLHDFWTWLHRREGVQLPVFPETPFVLGYRKIVGKETQAAILDKVYDMTFHINPKIWLGIKWLCTYTSVRPGELIQIREEHLDLENP